MICGSVNDHGNASLKRRPYLENLQMAYDVNQWWANYGQRAAFCEARREATSTYLVRMSRLC